MPEPALLVVGMHRSGTSMVGGMLAAAGVSMGERLIAADRANPRGYFEDAGVVELHGRLFREALPADDGPHVDWGVTASREVEGAALLAHAEDARRLAASLAPAAGPWGFKDPRTTMALPLWDAVLPDARYLLVYRFPWEVADSMQRGGAPEFQRAPAYAFRAWEVYNERLLAFHAANRERCVLVSSNALTAAADSPGRLAALLAERLSIVLDPAALASGVDARLFTAGDPDDRRADLVRIAYPRCVELLRRLDEAADLPASGLWRAGAPGPTRLTPPADAPVELSVVVPTWNDGVLLLEAVASVERHAPPETELLVVNDGSTDPESLRVLGALEGAGYRVLHKQNGGLSSARNLGIEAARGRYVLPLDADNRLLGGFLEEALRVLREDAAADVVYGDRRLFGGMSGVLPTPDFDLRAMLGGNRIDACALYRREMWTELGGYDTGMSGLEDWEFWLHAARRGRRFVHLDRLAFEYRVRGNSLLAASLRPGVRLRLFGRVLDRHTELFHGEVPLPLRPASLLLGRLVPGRFARRLRRHECALFWHPLWFLIGSGGLVSDDREQIRAHRARA